MILPKQKLKKFICHSDHREESLQLVQWLKIHGSKISRYSRDDNLRSDSFDRLTVSNKILSQSNNYLTEKTPCPPLL